MPYTQMMLCVLAAAVSLSANAQYDVLDLYMTRMASMRKFTGTVLLAEGNKVLYHKSVGPAKAAADKANTNESAYLIGSVTKTFTATLVLRLAEQKRLTLDDALHKYLPTFPRSEEVTIRHLLSHTSGIPSYTELSDFNEWKYQRTVALEIIDRVAPLSYRFDPGTYYEYSNTNYILLGHIIETVTGKPWDIVMREGITGPLNMEHTGTDPNRRGLKLSEGLTASREGYASVPMVHPSVPGAAGALYSTTTDLLKFSRALHSGQLFAERQTLTLMTTPVKDSYGLGIYRSKVAGMDGIGHNGGIDGYAAQWVYFPEKDLHLITLSNNMTADHAAVGEAMVRTYLGETIEIPAERKLLHVKEDILERYVGAYELATDVLLDIYIENGGLKARATKQDAFDLYAQSDSSFYALVAVIDITFHMGDDGKASALTLEQGGAKIKARRFVLPDLRLQLPEAKLKRLEGTYEIQPGFNLEISVKDGKLMAQATGQPSFELFAESDTRFFATEAFIDVEFEIKGGKATAVTLNQAGHVMRAEKQ
jgi:CubicO group peptidase (beta-lactamase class C family)